MEDEWGIGKHFDFEDAVESGLISEEIATNLRRALATAHRHGSLAAKTVESYGYNLSVSARWFKSHGYVMLPLERDVAVLYAEYLVDVSRSHSSADIPLRILSAVSKYAALPRPYLVEADAIVKGARRMGRLHRQRQAGRITAGDIDVLMRNSEADNSQHQLGIAVICCALFGMSRVSEIQGYRMEHIRETSYGWEIFIPTRKNDKLRDGMNVRIPARYANIVMRWRRKFRPKVPDTIGPVFCNRQGKPFTTRWLSKAVYEVLKAGGIKGVSIHSGRVSAVTTALESGISPKTIAMGGGWHNEATVEIYGRNHMTDKAQRQIHDALLAGIEDDEVIELYQLD